jgi:hypothetical protein
MADKKKRQKKEIRAMLSTITVELPYETEEEAKEAEEFNKGLATLGMRTFRSGTDWGYREYKDTLVCRLEDNPMETKTFNIQPTRFQSGDLVKIFKTVSDGDVHWQGDIKLEFGEFPNGIQKSPDIKDKNWPHMFFDNMPAKLERKGKVIFGSLEPFSETGTEGIVWSICEYGKDGYDALHCLKNGDRLTVYSDVRDGEVEWEGKLEFSEKKIGKIGYVETVRDTNHMDTEKWLKLSWQNRPAIITPDTIPAKKIPARIEKAIKELKNLSSDESKSLLTVTENELLPVSKVLNSPNMGH